MADGMVVTFYSYKGGVGRSFALANVGVALAAWGYRVLCIDWDLEAPGLSHYFKVAEPHKGIVDLVLSVQTEPELPPTSSPRHESEKSSDVAKGVGDWRDYVVTVEPAPGEKLDLIVAGLQDGNYISRVQDLQWKELYEKHGLAQALEEWRSDWKKSYDFVLIDSRTGITDIGAICTAYLPDLLVVLFTANHQSIDGCVEVVDRAIAARKKLAFDRSALHVLPVPSRFDAKEEYKRAEEWRAIFGAKTGRFLGSWLEPGVDAAEVLNRATIPYVAYWSFGEGLPVAEELSRSPNSIRFSLETIAALLAHRLGNSRLLVETVEGYVHAAIRTGHRVGGYVSDVFLSATPDFDTKARELAEALKHKGFRVAIAEHEATTKSSAAEEPDRTLNQAHHAVFLVGQEFSAHIDGELRRFAKQLIDDQTDRMVLPICFYPVATQRLPSLLQRSQIEVKPEITVEALADVIARELRPAGKNTAPPEERPEVRLAHSKLNASNPLARKAAVTTLGRVGDLSVVDALVGRLQDSDERVRDEAKRAIIDIHKREQAARPGFVPDLQPLVASSDLRTRFVAAEIQARAGDVQGIYNLLAFLDEAEPPIRKEVAEVLGAIGNPIANDWLLVHTEDPNSEVRGAVIGALIRIGGLATTTIRHLLRFVKFDTKSAFAQALASIEDFSSLGPLLIDEVEQYVLIELIRDMLATPARPHVEDWLLQVLEKGPPRSMRAIASLLAGLGKPKAVEALVSRLSDRDEDVRSAAAQGLGAIGGPSAFKILATRSEDDSPQVREAVAQALGQIGGPEAVDVLVTRLADSAEKVRSAAAQALGKIRRPEAVDALVPRLSDSAENVRSAVARALAVIGSPYALKALVASSEDDSPQVREVVAQVHGVIGGPEAVDALVPRLSDSQENVRRVALQSLARVLKLDTIDLRLLTRDLDGTNPWIDPQAQITHEHIKRGCKALNLPEVEVHERLNAVRERLGGGAILPLPLSVPDEPANDTLVGAKRKRRPPKGPAPGGQKM